MNKIIIYVFVLGYAHFLDASELLNIPGGVKPLTTCGFFGNDRIAMPTDANTLAIYDLQGVLQKTISGHQSVISAYDQSATGQRCATGSYDTMVYQYDGGSCQMHHSHNEHEDNVSCICFSGDENMLVSLSWANNIAVHDTKKGDQRYFLNDPEPIITLAPDQTGNTLAISKKDLKTVELWLMKPDGDHEKFLRLTGHQKDIHGVDWNPDNLFIATGSADSTVKIWDSAFGQTITTFADSPGTRAPLGYSPDGALLAVGSNLDDIILLYDMRTSRPALELAGHAGGTDALAWNIDGTKIVSCSDREKTVKVWDIRMPVGRHARLTRFLKKCRELVSGCLPYASLE